MAGDQRLQRARIALALAGAVLAVGALLPWASVSAPNGLSFTLNSMDRASDGWATLSVGVIVIGVAAMRAGVGPLIIAGLGGLLALVTSVENWVHLRQILDRAEDTSPSPVHSAIGAGLWLTVLAALAIVVLCLWLVAVEWSAARTQRARRRG